MRLAYHAEHRTVGRSQFAGRQGDSSPRTPCHLRRRADRQRRQPAALRLRPHHGLVECTTGAFPAGVAAIRYRIHAGYTPDEVPDVQGVLINAAKRASSAAAGIVQSQSVNGSSVTYNVSLMADELAKLDRYKLGALP